MDMLDVLLIFATGLIAGFINVMAAGGSLLSLPVLIFMGLDGALANGTNRVAIFAQNVTAAVGFRNKGFHDFSTSFRYGVYTLPGAILGAFLAVRISDVWFSRILAGVILFGVWGLFFSPITKNKEGGEPIKPWIGAVCMFGVGIYGGFIQAAAGVLLMTTLYFLERATLVRVNMHKVFIVALYTVPSLLIFAISGNVNWLLGICLAVGNAIGGWAATHVAIKGGDKIIKWILALVLIAMAVKLFLRI